MLRVEWKWPRVTGRCSVEVSGRGHIVITAAEDLDDGTGQAAKLIERSRPMEVAVEHGTKRCVSRNSQHRGDRGAANQLGRFDIRDRQNGHQRVLDGVLGHERKPKLGGERHCEGGLSAARRPRDDDVHGTGSGHEHIVAPAPAASAIRR
jgi:hypothetical protein